MISKKQCIKKFTGFYFKKQKHVIGISVILFIIFLLMPFITTRRMDLNTPYTDKEDVALYVIQHHELPPNYITKSGLEYAKKKGIFYSDNVIGGDTFFNDGKLKKYGVGKEEKLKESDIVGYGYRVDGTRGEERLVYTCNTENVRVFYTSDHYKSFEEMTHFRLQLTRNIFWIIFGVYALLFISFYVLVTVFIKGKELRNENDADKIYISEQVSGELTEGQK